jgi:hypothetical protein
MDPRPKAEDDNFAGASGCWLRLLARCGEQAATRGLGGFAQLLLDCRRCSKKKLAYEENDHAAR